MSTKLPTKREVTFVLAEDIRPEATPKFSVLGFIPGAQLAVVGSLPPGAPVNLAFVLPSLTFLFVLTGGEGRFKGHFRVVAPDKKTPVADVALDSPIVKLRGKTAVVGTSSKPFMGPAFGTYSVQLRLNTTKFAFPMVIEKGLLPGKS